MRNSADIMNVILKYKVSDASYFKDDICCNRKGIDTDALSVDNLPSVLPVLNLSSSLLMPRSQLPISVSTYNFISALPALMSGKIIAIIPTGVQSNINRVGCAGKIQEIQFDNDEVKILIHGVCRFEVGEQLGGSINSLQHVRVSYDRYKGDLEQTDNISNRERLLSAIESYFRKFSIDRNWSIIKDTPADILVSAITMAFPFHPLEKQALLETVSVEEQCEMIINIIEMDSYSHSLTPIKTIN